MTTTVKVVCPSCSEFINVDIESGDGRILYLVTPECPKCKYTFTEADEEEMIDYIYDEELLKDINWKHN